MRIVCISDTHELHRELEIPPADLLIHTGDWTFFSKNRNATADFNTWLGEQRMTLGRVLCPGNHEIYLEADPRRRARTDKASVLIGGSLTTGGLNI
jgi:predicted MPP superfamily phosphohydrolase